MSLLATHSSRDRTGASSRTQPPTHKARTTQQWQETNVLDFISTWDWPSVSPDLNLLDYKLWSKASGDGLQVETSQYWKSVCVCVPMPTHCTIMRFRFHARWIDGIKCCLFLNHASFGQTTLHVGRVSVWCTGGSWGYGDCMCNCLCSVIVLCGMMMKGREKVKPGAGS